MGTECASNNNQTAHIIVIGGGTIISTSMLNALYRACDMIGAIIVNVGTPGHCDHGIEWTIYDDYLEKPQEQLFQDSWQKMNKGCFSKKERRMNNPQRRVLSHAK